MASTSRQQSTSQYTQTQLISAAVANTLQAVSLQVRLTMRSLIGTNTCAKMFDIDFIAGCLAWLNKGRYPLFHNSPCVDIVGHVAEIYIQDESMIFLRLDAETLASVCSREDTAGINPFRTRNKKTTALGCELQHGCITVGPITVTETSGATDFVLAGVRCGQGISQRLERSLKNIKDTIHAYITYPAFNQVGTRLGKILEESCEQPKISAHFRFVCLDHIHYNFAYMWLTVQYKQPRKATSKGKKRAGAGREEGKRLFKRIGW